MILALGIDTGGTYTDAVLMDYGTGAILHSAKALTSRPDLSSGIREAMSQVLDLQDIDPSCVGLVSLSTTLATNAIVEGHGGPVCLILIGYDRGLIQEFGFESELVTPDIVYVRGGHNVVGDETEPLDEDALREAVIAYADHVTAFAVSGYFAARNPSHELRARAVIEDALAACLSAGAPLLPVTCGHELSGRLNSVRRATTAVLNARLIPLLQHLISTVQRTLSERGIPAPLMVVKGDGSLVRADWAMLRPVETILSGPAASAVGAWHLAGRQDVWVVDIGGTTTDIVALKGGRPRLNPEGAQVGRWRTMVEAVDIQTSGLGGDSLVLVDDNAQLRIGPGRAVPLCLLATEHPNIRAELERQIAKPLEETWAGQFVFTHDHPSPGLSGEEIALLRAVGRTPKSLDALIREAPYRLLGLRRVARLEATGSLFRAGFTPTDALHVLGRFRRWDAEASWRGARLLAARLGCTPEAFCQRVATGVSEQILRQLISKILADEGSTADWDAPAANALFARAVGKTDSSLNCQFHLREPLVSIGAPAEAYSPLAADLLHAEIVIPQHAAVANAVGAVAGGVIQQWRVMVQPLFTGEAFRMHLPGGVRDFPSLEEAAAYAQKTVPSELEAVARQAGAAQVEVHMTRHDRVGLAQAGWGHEVYLCTELTFTATGRPSRAR